MKAVLLSFALSGGALAVTISSPDIKARAEVACLHDDRILHTFDGARKNHVYECEEHLNGGTYYYAMGQQYYGNRAEFTKAADRACRADGQSGPSLQKCKEKFLTAAGYMFGAVLKRGADCPGDDHTLHTFYGPSHYNVLECQRVNGENYYFALDKTYPRTHDGFGSAADSVCLKDQSPLYFGKCLTDFEAAAGYEAGQPPVVSSAVIKRGTSVCEGDDKVINAVSAPRMYNFYECQPGNGDNYYCTRGNKYPITSEGFESAALRACDGKTHPEKAKKCFDNLWVKTRKNSKEGSAVL